MKSEKEYYKAGFHFTWGAINCVGIMFLIGLVITHVLHSPDDCDKSWWEPCGMKVVVDNKTGKEYLLSPYGGIIERPKL